MFLGAVALATGIVVKLGFIKRYNLARCVLAIQSAVQEVYGNYVKDLKRANADGKLTEDEKAEAVAQAYQRAKTIVSEEGIDLAKYYGPRISRAIIDAAVNKSKTAGRIAKGLLPVGAA